MVHILRRQMNNNTS